ncbi:MAG: hypothetical protein WEA58_09315 [Balneolaceae bacterium]
MKINTIAVFLMCFVFTACGEERASEEMNNNAQEAFFSNLSSLCGETFSGESTFPEDDPDNVLVGTELRAHVKSCEEEIVEVDFLRDGDTWHATWVLEMREDGLHLYHEHIGDKEYPEGEEPLTGYGGYADDRGNQYHQYFPADEYTAGILPEAVTNVWSMEYVPAEDKFVYYLERHEEPRFKAELTRMTD